MQIYWVTELDQTWKRQTENLTKAYYQRFLLATSLNASGCAYELTLDIFSVVEEDRGMAMEEERERAAGLFTELNIHNHFDWVENNNFIPQHESMGFVKS